MALVFKNTVLFSPNKKVMKEFYIRLFDLEVEMDFGLTVGFTNGIAIWQVPDEHLLNQRKLVDVGAKGNFELYFECDDIPALMKKLEEEKVDFAHDLHTETWLQYTIRFFDPDGNLVEVGESLHVLVKRLKKDGMAVQEIVQRTSIPQPQVEYLLTQ